jgi:hypothetical protein
MDRVKKSWFYNVAWFSSPIGLRLCSKREEVDGSVEGINFNVV